MIVEQCIKRKKVKSEVTELDMIIYYINCGSCHKLFEVTLDSSIEDEEVIRHATDKLIKTVNTHLCNNCL
jgi:hypothetical protein